MINEIMYHPIVPNASFVEIYNTSGGNAFDLSGCRLSGADFTFPPGTIIAPNSFLVLARDRVTFGAAYGGTIPVAGEFDGQLANRGETLKLIQPGPSPDADEIIDQVSYDSAPPWPAAANGAGSSLQLIDATLDNNRVANWTAVNTNDPPAIRRSTPGAANSVRASLALFHRSIYALPPNAQGILWSHRLMTDRVARDHALKSPRPVSGPGVQSSIGGNRGDTARC